MLRQLHVKVLFIVLPVLDIDPVLRPPALKKARHHHELHHWRAVFKRFKAPLFKCSRCACAAVVSASAYRQRRVHFAQGLVDQHFSIVIADALDGFVYLHAAPLQVSVVLIRPRLFSFFVPWRSGIVVGHRDAPSLRPTLTTNSTPSRTKGAALCECQWTVAG